MSLNAVYLVLALVAATTVVGVVWRRRQGTAKKTSAKKAARGQSTIIRPADLVSNSDSQTRAATPSSSETLREFGAEATLLQFSTEFCSSCPATRRMLGAIAEARPGVTHLDVDLTYRADLANRYSILQTPTTFILDRDGALVARIGGPVRPDVVKRQLDELTGAHA